MTLLPSITWGTWPEEEVNVAIKTKNTSMNEKRRNRRQNLKIIRKHFVELLDRMPKNNDDLKEETSWYRPNSITENTWIWSTLPAALDPYEGGHVPIQRKEKKRQQVQNMVISTQPFIEYVNSNDEFVAFF